MSRSVLRRLMPFIAGRIQQNSRLLSSAAVEASSSSSPESQESIHMTENCIRRLKELQGKEASSGEKMLRLSVETGGCSGFQYVFLLDDKRNTDDRVFEKDGVKLVVDNICYDFVKGATVDYVEELIRSAFLTMKHILQITVRDPDGPVRTKGRPRNAFRIQSGLDNHKGRK